MSGPPLSRRTEPHLIHGRSLSREQAAPSCILKAVRARKPLREVVLMRRMMHPFLLLGVMMFGSWTPASAADSPASKSAVTVFAAASLSEAFKEIGAAF